MDKGRDKKAGEKPVSGKDHPPAGEDVSVPQQDKARKDESMQGGGTGGGSGTPVDRTPAENPQDGNRRGDDNRQG